jgi:hypothetical protein
MQLRITNEFNHVIVERRKYKFCLPAEHVRIVRDSHNLAVKTAGGLRNQQIIPWLNQIPFPTANAFSRLQGLCRESAVLSPSYYCDDLSSGFDHIHDAPSAGSMTGGDFGAASLAAGAGLGDRNEIMGHRPGDNPARSDNARKECRINAR